MESNLVNFVFNSSPFIQNESQGTIEDEINEIRIQEKNEVNQSDLEICDTRENSELNSSFLERRISNSSSSQIVYKAQTSELANSTENEIQNYYSDTIEYLKKTNPEMAVYSKSKNYLLKKGNIERKNLIQNQKQFITINYQFILCNIIKINDYLSQAIYFHPILGYYCFNFPCRSIISNGNTGKNKIISDDEKDEIKASDISSNSNKKDEVDSSETNSNIYNKNLEKNGEDQKQEEQKEEEEKEGEQKWENMRRNHKRNSYKKFNNNRKRNNYYKNKYHQGSFYNNYAHKKYSNHFHNSEY